MLTSVEVFTMGAPSLLMPLTAEAIEINPIQIKNIDGQNPVTADVSFNSYATDGADAVGSRIDKRNLVFTIGLNPNWETQTMEELRYHLYRYFMTKSKVTLQFESTNLPTCKIDGIVESFIANIFSKDPEIQISILCPKPDFIGIDPVVITGQVNTENSGAPNEIIYEGTVPTGMEIVVVKSDANLSEVSLVDILVETSDSHERFRVDLVTIDSTWFYWMNSIPGNKFVRQTKVSNHAEYLSLLRLMPWWAVWPQLRPGANDFRVISAQAGQTWTLTYYPRFGGL